MSAPMNVGTLVGYLTLDDTGIDKGVRGATQKIQGFAKTGATEGGKAGTAIGKSAGDKTVQEYGKAEGKLVDKTRTMFSSVGKMATGILGGIGVASILTKGWDRLTGIENAQAKLKGLGHDGEAVEQIMANALASVKGTAFGMAEAATTAAGAVAAGIQPGEELETVLKAVANSAAAAGVGMDEMGGIFNKVASLGKAQNDVLQQVANQGLPIYQKLAEQFGVTADEVFKMATRSEIGFAQFEAAMKSAAGTVADEMGQTTTGAISNLGAAMSRLGAGLLSDVMPAIKGTAEALTWLADAWGAIPGPAKAATLALGGFIALSKLGALAKLSEWLLLARVRVAELSSAAGPHGLAASLTSLGKSLAMGGAVAAAGLSISLFGKMIQEAKPKVTDFTAAIDENTGALRENGVQSVITGLQQSGAVDGLERFGVTLAAYTKAVIGEGDAYDTVRGQLEAYEAANWSNHLARDAVQKQIRQLDADHERFAGTIADTTAAIEANADVTGDAEASIARARTQYEKYGFVVNEAARSTDGYTDAAQVAAAATEEEAKAAEEARQKHLDSASAVAKLGTEMRDAYSASDLLKSGLSAVIARLDELSGRAVDAEDATRKFNGVLSDASKALELGKDDTGSFKAAIDQTTGAIDTSTTAGQKLYDWVTNAAGASRDAALAQAEYTAKTEGIDVAAKGAAKTQREQIRAFKDAGTQAGLTRDQVQNLIDTYFDVPKEIRTTVLGDPDFRRVNDELQRLADNTVYVNVQGRMVQSGIPGQIGGARADGGEINGRGPKGVDSVLTWLAPGEHVWTAAEVDRLGGQSAMYNLRRAVMNAPGFASGGSLTSPTAQALSGLPGPQYGPVQGAAMSALAEYVGLVGATSDAAKNAAGSLKDATKALADLTRSQQRDAKDRERNYERTKRSEDEAVQAAKDRLAEVKKETAAKIADAKTSKDKATRVEAATKDIDAAEAVLDKARRQRRERLGDLERTMNRANKEDEKKLKTAEKQAALAERENAAAQQRSQAVANLVAATASLRTEQAGLAAELDTTNEALAGARSALDNLVQASQQMKDSISSGFLGGSAISQFASGVPVESMLAKLQQQLGMSQGISQSIMSLAGRGLNGTMLEDLARMGLSGAGLASALAGATDTQLQQFNSLQGQLKAAADATGTVVADAIYSNDIKIADRQVAVLTAQTDRIEAALEKNATRMENLMSLAMQGLGTDVSTSADRAANTVAKAVSGAVSAAAAVAKTTVKGKGLSS